MTVHQEVLFRNMSARQETKDFIDRKIQKLERIYPQMTHCRVAVEYPHKHHKRGNHFEIKLHITVPHHSDIFIKEESEGRATTAQADLTAVIQKAFNSALRQLKTLSQKKTMVKQNHSSHTIQAIVEKIFKDDGYGFLRTIDNNQQVYFHRNSVIHDDFETLNIGTGVRFVGVMAEEGYQASTVKILDKH